MECQNVKIDLLEHVDLITTGYLEYLRQHGRSNGIYHSGKGLRYDSSFTKGTAFPNGGVHDEGVDRRKELVRIASTEVLGAIMRENRITRFLKSFVDGLLGARCDGFNEFHKYRLLRWIEVWVFDHLVLAPHDLPDNGKYELM